MLLTWRPLTSSWSQSRWMLRSPSCASFSRLEASLSFLIASCIFLSAENIDQHYQLCISNERITPTVKVEQHY